MYTNECETKYIFMPTYIYIYNEHKTIKNDKIHITIIQKQTIIIIIMYIHVYT